MVDLSPEFSGGGIVFRALPVGSDRECPTAKFLLSVATKLWAGAIDMREYVLPSTGIIRLGCQVSDVHAIRKEGEQVDLQEAVQDLLQSRIWPLFTGSSNGSGATILHGSENRIVGKLGNQGTYGVTGIQGSYGATGAMGWNNRGERLEYSTLGRAMTQAVLE